MKPKTLFPGLLILMLITISACEEDDTPTCSYPENARLKRIVHCYEYNIDCSTIEWDGTIEQVYEYDQSGRIEKVLERPRYEDGVLIRMSEYQLYDYDSEGKLVNIEYFSTYRDEYVHDKNRVFTYSEDGKKIREYIDWMNSDWFQYSLFEYTNNRLSRIENYEINSDELENYIQYEYDDLGNLVKETTYNKYDVPYSYTEHFYENGLNVKTHHATGSFIKTYDENENLIYMESNYLPGSSKGNFRYKYEYFF